MTINQDHDGRGVERLGTPGIGPKGAARRRFARAGLGASGVILTLASKPGMAMTSCTSMSGFESGRLASNSPTNVCEGRSPGYWKNWPDQWAGANTSAEAKFGDIFGAAGTDPALSGMTLMDVLDPPKVKQDKAQKGATNTSDAVVKDVDPDNVARHVIAALLNARSRKVSKPVESDVREIWRQYSINRSFSPKPGVIWNGPDIVFYLKTTMI